MTETVAEPIILGLETEQILADYRLVYLSRQVSLIGRREVMSGKAKFGIFGDGKELVQAAMAHYLLPGDFRSGYYRDQTLMIAAGALSLPAFFAQLYAHAEIEADPATAGRSMNAHFATRSLEAHGKWKDLTAQFNSSADVSPTASQMPRLVGLAYASRLYRELPELSAYTQFSHQGDEIAFGSIGNASCAEGMFWEAVNAIGVLKSPAVITIYDDEYGISVPNHFQITKEDLNALLQGFARAPNSREGYDIYQVRGWDYPALLEAYRTATETARREHVPAILHIVELTQPQGHSTSGSHERYKSAERLAWEEEYDCLDQFRKWILVQELIGEKELEKLESATRKEVENARRSAWQAFSEPILQERRQAAELITALESVSAHQAKLALITARLKAAPTPLRRDIFTAVQAALVAVRGETSPERQALIDWRRAQLAANRERYSSQLQRNTALQVPVIPARYSADSPRVYGFEILNACFDAALAREPRLIAFGEDVGRLGDVNQGFRGLQDKYGELRVADTGIREATILGQAIGLAMRGLRPIAEIQYLDYLLYALQIMSDDLATLLWRTRGGQKAPVIVRTRGHRLEGIWHSGSPMAGILNLVRGMHVLVPRNMTQAAGFYNTLLQADEPALVIEVLNGYRIRERLPENIGEFTTPLGIPETLRAGEDISIVTYGAACRIVLEAAERLDEVGVSAEVIDVQSLLPFDVEHRILESLKKTGRILFVDEDVPGGATAYMQQQVIEKQGGYFWLDSPPRTLSAQPHRPAYGSDGDYFSKPNAETIFEAAYEMLNEVDPASYPPYTE
ncbi:MAG TPA: thiamine pyrophosphate-dependent enzyme [Anaerolineales bacterium]|nr:thiamine pyrophosphate-dependent enzyme [Anaerolineales bacterium]